MDPERAYASRLDTRREEQAVLERRDRSLSIARGIVGAIVVLALVALGWVRSLAVVLGLATLAFVVLVVVHERVARQLARARRRVAFHEAALDRVRGTGSAVASPARASSIRIIPTPPTWISSAAARCSSASAPRARTRARTCSRPGSCGMRRSTPCARARARRPSWARSVDLREDMAVLGAEARRAVDSKTLADWAAGASPLRCPRACAALAFACSGAALVALLASTGGACSRSTSRPPVSRSARWRARPFSRAVLAGIGRPVHDLQALAEIFDRLAGERFESPRLAELHTALSAEGEPPARPIARLKRWLEIHESKRNVFFAILAFYLVWDLQLAAAVEGWRRRFGAPVVALAGGAGRAGGPGQPGNVRVREPGRSLSRSSWSPARCSRRAASDIRCSPFRAPCATTSPSTVSARCWS